MEFQDWRTPPPSPDLDDMFPGHDGHDTSDDSDDSNYNGYHPGFIASSGAGRRPRTTRFGGDGDPALGPGSGPACRPQQRPGSIQVGAVACPLVIDGLTTEAMLLSTPKAATGIPGVRQSADFDAQPGTRVDPDLASSPEPGLWACPALAFQRSARCDPMRFEASLLSPQSHVMDAATPPGDVVFSVDVVPKQGSTCISHRLGLVGSEIRRDLGLLLGRSLLSSFDEGPRYMVDEPVAERAVFMGLDLLEQSGGNERRLGLVDSWSSGEIDASLCEPQQPSVQSFIASFARPLQTPLVAEPPQLRRTKVVGLGDDDFVPKRSARLAAKSGVREPRPEAQARKVLMKRLGFDEPTKVQDEASFEEFQHALARPLTSAVQEAMDTLFPGPSLRAPVLAGSGTAAGGETYDAEVAQEVF